MTKDSEVPKTVQVATMKALVYHGPGKKTWEPTPKPAILKTTDAVVKIVDAHLLKGSFSDCAPSRKKNAIKFATH